MISRERPQAVSFSKWPCTVVVLTVVDHIEGGNGEAVDQRNIRVDVTRNLGDVDGH